MSSRGSVKTLRAEIKRLEATRHALLTTIGEQQSLLLVAIVQERERCAKIAAEWVKDPRPHDNEASVCRDVAAAIRRCRL